MGIEAELGQYILQTRKFKKNLKIQWGEFECPLWGRRWAYLKLQQEWIAGWIKLTFGQLVSKSIYHVWQVGYLVVGAGLGLGLW